MYKLSSPVEKLSKKDSIKAKAFKLEVEAKKLNIEIPELISGTGIIQVDDKTYVTPCGVSYAYHLGYLIYRFIQIHPKLSDSAKGIACKAGCRGDISISTFVSISQEFEYESENYIKYNESPINNQIKELEQNNLITLKHVILDDDKRQFKRIYDIL